jgi:hypothetical protein
MAKKDAIENELNIMTNEEIEGCDDLQKALALINKEQVVPESVALVKKQFIVEKNKDIKDLSKLSMDEKNDAELDEISNQADQAFYDLMDVAVNSTGKACGDIASAAQSFLNIKLSAKMAKTELKLKRMKQELDEKKFQLSSMPKESGDDDYSPDDDIIIIDSPQNQ